MRSPLQWIYHRTFCPHPALRATFLHKALHRGTGSKIPATLGPREKALGMGYGLPRHQPPGWFLAMTCRYGSRCGCKFSYVIASPKGVAIRVSRPLSIARAVEGAGPYEALIRQAITDRPCGVLRLHTHEKRGVR